MPTLDKLPPFEPEAETSVIGSLLIDDQSIVRLSLLLEEKDFFREANGWIFAACKALYERDEAINQITVASELERQGKLNEAGGPAYLQECIAGVPTSLHADHYANIVKRTSVNRQMISVAGKIAQIGYDNSADVSKAIAQAEELLFALRQGSATQGFIPLRAVLEGCITEMTAPKGERQEGARIATGFVDLDRLLGGLHPSDLIIIAARPSQGKSAICLNIAEQTALKGIRVGVFSLEMSRSQVAYRLLAAHAGVDLQQLTLDKLNGGDEAKVVDSLGQLSEAAIYIDDARGQRVGAIRSRAKQLANQYGLDLLIVDYVGLVRGTGRGENRVQEIGEISRGMKALAGELNVPVVMAAQLSRAVEQRPDHRPMLSDLRESGDLEQDADVVAFIYREDKYITSDEWQRKHTAEPYPAGVAEIIIAKHRNGPTGSVKLLFHEASTRFRPMEGHRVEEEPYWMR